MKRLIASTLCCGLIFAVPAHATEVYKCTDKNGRLVFSQKPCAKDAEKITVAGPAQIGASAAGSDFTEFDAKKAKDDKAKTIANIYKQIDGLRIERDNKINNLKQRQGNVARNLAGATYMQSLATEMQSVTDDYNGRIEMEMKEIESLRSEKR